MHVAARADFFGNHSVGVLEMILDPALQILDQYMGVEVERLEQYSVRLIRSYAEN